MTVASRRPLQEAAIPVVCILLVALFMAFQFLATPSVGSVRFLPAAQTSSPRDSGGLQDQHRSGLVHAHGRYRQHKSEPGPFQSQEVRVEEAEGLLAQAARALDLRDIPPVELDHRRLEAPLLLKEILDRLPLPDPDTIPGDADVAKQAIPTWNVPGAEIRIVRASEGPRAGEYLFSRETVRQLDDSYKAIRDEPEPFPAKWLRFAARKCGRAVQAVEHRIDLKRGGHFRVRCASRSR